MLERLLVGAIVLVAIVYSTWALLPAPARRKVAASLGPFASASWCPGWLARRLRDAASGAGPNSNPCNGCSAHAPPGDDARR